MGSASLLAGIADVAGAIGIDVLNPLASDWHVLNNDGSIAVTPDTVPRFEFRGESRISDYPVEQGAFASYNKVATPFEIRMQMIVSGINYAQKAVSALGLNFGQQFMTRPDFLDTMDYMLGTTDLFTIVTPDKVYKNANLEHYDFRKESRNGAIMLIVEAWFREVRVTGSASYSNGSNSSSPSASSPVNIGSVQTFPLGTNPATALQGII